MDDDSGSIGVKYRWLGVYPFTRQQHRCRASPIGGDRQVGQVAHVGTGWIHRTVHPHARVQMATGSGESRCIAFADGVEVDAMLPGLEPDGLNNQGREIAVCCQIGTTCGLAVCGDKIRVGEFGRLRRDCSASREGQ